MPWQKLNPQVVVEILERFKAGESPLDLAAEFGVSRANIDHHLRKEFGPRPRGKLSEEDRREIVRRWERGEVAAHLAHEFGIGFSAVSKLILKRTGRRVGRIRRKNEIRLPEDPTTLAYLAAMIDAEGCITRNTRKSACTWQVVITNTSPELEVWLRKLGGNVYYVSERRASQLGHVKQCFEWKVTTAWNIYRLLEAVLPFLVIKRDRACEALQDISSRFDFPPVVDSLSENQKQLSIQF